MGCTIPNNGESGSGRFRPSSLIHSGGTLTKAHALPIFSCPPLCSPPFTPKVPSIWKMGYNITEIHRNSQKFREGFCNLNYENHGLRETLAQGSAFGEPS